MIKILAIDDNNDNLISLKAILRDVFPDVVVLTSQNGHHGIEIATSEIPDIILLDIVMPDMDGFEVCQRLKKDKRVQNIPVIFITALKDDKKSRIKALEIGAEGFLSKPIDESELIAQVKAMLKIKAAYNEVRNEKEHLSVLVDKRTQELKKSNEMLFKLTEQVPGVVYQYRLYQDGHSCFPYSSPGMIDIYGLTPEEVREDATPVFSRIHPEDHDHIVYSIQESARTLKLYHSEFRVILPELGVRWRLCDAKPERMEDGSTLWYGIISDITERKIAENSLRESEFFFKESQRAAFVGSYKFDLLENHWTSSEILDQIFGITQSFDKKLGSWLDLTHPEDREMLDRYFAEEVVGKRSTFNKVYRIVRKSDGETRWVLGLGRLLINDKDVIISMMGTIQDITERILAGKAITENENRYRELFEANSDSIAIFQIGSDQTTLKFLDCNENNARLLGYSKEEMFQFQPKDIEVPISEEIMLRRKEDLLKNRLIEFETKLKHKSGQLIDVEIKTVLITFNSQPAIMNISRDITKRKQIEERIKLLAFSLESINECVTITDNNDRIIYVNKSFLNTYGYIQEELIGQHTGILRSQEQAFKHTRNILPGTLEGGWRGEIMNRKKDGTLFPILLSTSVIKDDEGNPIALIGVATDISDMLKARAELIAAKEQAVESNQLKTAFLNNMSHEIRTPMNHIMGFSSLMSEAQGTEKDDYAEIILNSSNQLLSLIENVILLSRLQSEKIELNKQTFDPSELISSLGNLFRTDCKSKDLSLNVRIPREKFPHNIYTDHEKIKQILIILTSNAVKYTKDGNIEVGYDIVEKHDHASLIHGQEMEKTNDRASLLQFYVKDTGIGIPLKEHEKIFDSFYRTERAISLAIGGTGLGLSIAKELVKSMDGSIWMESEQGKGSIFRFTIPVIITNELAYEEKLVRGTRHILKDMSILIADDEQINFLYLEILLKSSVKKIDHAYNGKEAVDMVSKKMYDLIFMDLKMPEMNGYDATKKIKLIHPDIPIIAQTAYASVEDKEKAIIAGCDDFIAKPIKKIALLELIEKYS